jgi:hypothetical protein
MIRSARIAIACVVATAAWPALAVLQVDAQERKPSPIPNPPPRFGPSYQSPYNFAPPAPIYPTPGGELFTTPYQGGNGYTEKRAPAPPPRDSSSKSQRLDTRLGPAR